MTTQNVNSKERRFCPHCGSTVFKALMYKPCAVEMDVTTGEYKLVREGEQCSFEVKACANSKCNAKLSDKDLVSENELKVKCSDCGVAHSKGDLINGLCPICYAKKNRPEILNMSQEELIRMLLMSGNTNATSTEVSNAQVQPKTQTSDSASQQSSNENVSASAPTKVEAVSTDVVTSKTAPSQNTEESESKPVEEHVNQPVQQADNTPSPEVQTGDVNNTGNKLDDPVTDPIDLTGGPAGLEPGGGFGRDTTPF